MSKFRTPKKDRPTYIYKDAYGRTVAKLKPGEEGITESWIIALHGDDDDVHNAAKRDSYHGVTSLEPEYENDVKNSPDKHSGLADYSSNPETIFFDALEAAEFSEAFKAVWDGLTDKQRRLVIKKKRGMSNVKIAEEEGGTPEAVRNRLLKIQKKFIKFLK